MQVLRVLIAPQVGEHATGSVLLFHLRGNTTNDGEHLVEDPLVEFAKVGERWNMDLRNYHDVDRPAWPGVMKGQHIIGLFNDFDRYPSAQRFVAIEVVRHPPILAARRIGTNRARDFSAGRGHAGLGSVP